MEPPELLAPDVVADAPGDGAGGADPYDYAPEPAFDEDGMQGLHDAESVAEPVINWQLAGEALAAVTGLFPVGAITREQGARAEALLADAAAAAQKFCKFKDFARFKARKRPDFEETWLKLQPLTEQETEVATADLTDPDLIEAWGTAVNNARAALRAVWPVQIRETPTGPDWIEPGVIDGGKASDILAALNSPLEMLADLQRGSLTPSQVAAVELAYPELFPRLQLAYETALKQNEGKRCPWSHESQLRVLFNAPSTLVGFGPADAEKKAGNAEIKIDFGDLRTKGQAIR